MKIHELAKDKEEDYERLAKDLHLDITGEVEMLINEDSPVGSRQIVQKTNTGSKGQMSCRAFTFSDLTSFTPKVDS